MADSSTITPLITGDESGFATFLLSSLFGHGWENVVTESQGTSYVTSLFNMFADFNSTVMFGLGILITWTLVSSVAGSAYAGKPIGEKNGKVGLWTPMRMAFSVGMIVPIPTVGLSLFQAIILALILPSINAADSLTSSIVGSMTGQSMTATSENKSADVVRPLVFDLHNTNVLTSQKQIFELAVMSNLAGQKGSYFVLDNNNQGQTWGFKTESGGTIGEFTIKCTEIDVKAGLCAIKKTAYARNIAKTMLIAQEFQNKIINKDYGLKKCLGQDLDTTNCTALKLSNTISETTLNIAKVITDHANDVNTKIGELSTKIRTDINDGGFLMLGSYYMRINKLNREYNQLLAINTDYKIDRDYAIKISENGFDGGQLKVATEAADKILRRMPFSGGDNVFNKIDSLQVKDESGLMRMFQAHFLGALASRELIGNIIAGKEPILQIQNFGLSILTAVDGTMAAISTAKATISTAKQTSKDAIDAATATPFLGTAAAGALAAVRVPLVFSSEFLKEYTSLFGMWTQTIFGALALVVFFISYYLPALPVILWTLAVLGWLIMVIEAVVAAPVWIAAHAMPEGDGIAGEHGRKGYIMLLNILLRPSLMVIGFFISIALVTSFSSFAIYMLTNGVEQNLLSSESTLYGGLYSLIFSFVGGLLILGGTLLVIIHKSLNLVTWLPENVINWVGGSAQSMGEENDERRVAGIAGYVSQTVNNESIGSGKESGKESGNESSPTSSKRTNDNVSLETTKK